MVYDGYLRMGGNEIVNSPRAEGITRSYDCFVPWLVGESCPFLQDAIGDSPYSYANIATAPWYDPSNPELSSRVLGIYGMGFSGVKDSTRQVQVTEGLDDGGVIGSMRKGVRQVRTRLAIVAIGEDAMEYARTWLEASLDPGACGQHAEECGTTDVEYLAACPPERAQIPYYSDWAVQQTNLLTNPSGEAAGSPVVVRTNWIRNSNFETDASLWTTTNAATQSRSTAQAHRGTASLQVVTAGTTSAEGIYSSTYTIPGVVQGTPYAASFWVLAPVGAAMEALANTVGTGGTVLVVSFTGTGAWQFISLPNNLSNSGLAPYILIRTRGTAQAITFYVDEAILETGVSTAGTYFDAVSQPRLRTNQINTPQATAAWPSASPGTGGVATTSFVPDARFGGGNARRVDWSTGASASGWINFPQGSFTRVGETWFLSMRYAITGNTLDPVISLGGGAPPVYTPVRGVVDHGDGTRTAWLLATITSLGSGNGNAQPILSAWGTMAAGGSLLAGSAYMEQRSDFTPYFDGGGPAKPGFAYAFTGTANASPSIEWDADFSTRWQGAANSTASELTGVAAPGVTLSSVTGLPVIRSSRFAAEGLYSFRSMGGVVPASGAYFEFGGMTAGSTYTNIITTYSEAQMPTTSQSRQIAVRCYGSTISPLINGPAAGAAPSTTTLRHTFTVPADTATGTMRIYVSSAAPGTVIPDTWYDLAAIIPGTYTGPAFTGSSTPVDPTLQRYRWTGVADASTSVYETRQLLYRPQTDDEYAAVVDPLRRFLHGVAATSGPTTVQQFHRQRETGGDIVGQVVEFTLTASRPWVYGITKPVNLPSTTPFVVEDVQFNLVPYPSMQLSTTPLVATAVNLSTNPSVEVDAVGWAFNQAAPITAAMLAGARSTELAAVGLASYKVTFTASAGGTGGWFSAEQVVALPASPPARARYSISMWGAAIVTTGTPVVTNIQHIAEWLNSTGTVLRTDTIGTVTPTGGASSLAQIAPPAGATQVRVSARCNMASFASGNVVRLFADALTVSTP